MNSMPTTDLEALAFHEGLPGHHLQLSIAAELGDVPDFQRHTRFTAFSEGWGLYSEYLAREMGFYEDPYSNFGRLAMELWRAARLVVDTGLHYKQWTREQAVAYLMANTPNAEYDCQKAIERYIAMPGQATAYMIGKLRIVELREMAEELSENSLISAPSRHGTWLWCGAAGSARGQHSGADSTNPREPLSSLPAGRTDFPLAPVRGSAHIELFLT